MTRRQYEPEATYPTVYSSIEEASRYWQFWVDSADWDEEKRSPLALIQIRSAA